ncbi:hypothetical protein EVAR_2574_1 [Eumeta japonica]|uniref:Uncharacterized protein n=1 Tax=Eumeta variegata TaxID=151549 RepID=A0A4C1SM97_EUMVA|nr:hypothetical protein EVAR_2574_1 [Eumeta japonica]
MLYQPLRSNRISNGGRSKLMEVRVNSWRMDVGEGKLMEREKQPKGNRSPSKAYTSFHRKRNTASGVVKELAPKFFYQVRNSWKAAPAGPGRPP